MKYLFITIILIQACFYSFAQAPNTNWAHNYGSSVEAVHVDENGNCFTVGNFSQTTFGTFPLINNVGGNIFLYKSDMLGNVIWARQYGLSSMPFPQTPIKDVITDANGNIFIYGYFQENATFGTTTLTSAGATDLFISKLDPAGNVLWAKKFGNSGYDLGYNGALGIDNNGNVILGVRFQVSITVGTTNYSSAGAEDIVIIKFDTDGNILWSNKFGGGGKDENQGVTVDALGNSYFTGNFAGTVTFGSTTLTATGTSDIYILKLSPSGTVLWAKKMNGSGADFGAGIEITDDGALYVTGSFMGTLTFGGFSVTSVTPSNVGVVLSKLDSNGNVLWVESLGSTLDIYPVALAVKPDGNIVLNGTYTGSSTAGSSVGSFDVFFAEYDATGTSIWIKGFGSAGGDLSYCLAIGPNNAIYGGGKFNGTIQFDSYTFTSTNFNKGFLVCLSDCIPTTSSLTEAACESYTLNNQTYTSSGTYTQIIANAAGCDSTITLNLTINQPTMNSISVTECGSHVLNGQTYTSSGTYSQTLTNSVACDSIITLNLTINQPTTNTITTTACGSYVLNSQTYTSSGIYSQLLANSVGCDSTITLNLTIDNVDNAVSVNSITLTSNQTGGTYQWIDCNNGSAQIVGATAQSFTATENGSYAVIVTANGCTETSDCFVINSVGIESLELDSWSVHPNPTNGVFTITTIQPLKDDVVEVYSAIGQLVYKNVHSGNEIIIQLDEQPSGVYLLKLNKQQHLRILKF